MTVDVFNARSAAARSLFTRKTKDDILETQIECMAVVDIPDGDDSGWAFFDEEFQGGGKIRRPFLVVQGTVSELFIEDSDNRVFPCGAKRLYIKDFNKNDDKKDGEIRNAIPVRVNWRLSSDEISYLFSVGLAYSDFAPPDLLKGNKLEIPVNIIYRAIYESPICAVDIVEPDKLETSTLLNRYDTMFMNCEPSQELLAEKERGGVAVDLNYSDKVAVMDFEPEDVSDVIEIPDDTPVVSAEEEDPVLTPDEIEEKEASEKISETIENISVEYAAMRENSKPVNVEGVLDDIRREAAAEESDHNSGTFSRKSGTLRLSERIAALKARTANLAGDDTNDSGRAADNAEVITDMTNYGSDSEKGTKAEREHKKAEKDADDQRERMRNIDRAMDNRALNEGRDDISGFGASEGEKDVEEERRKIRNVDTALDNQTFNSGSSNVAGFGSGSGSLSQDLLSRVMPKTQRGGDLEPAAKPDDSQQRYL